MSCVTVTDSVGVLFSFFVCSVLFFYVHFHYIIMFLERNPESHNSELHVGLQTLGIFIF